VIERLAQVARRASMLETLQDVLRVDVPRETYEKLEAYAVLLRDGSKRQNLVSASSLDDLWERHILDSAQLVRFEPHRGASWIDIGSGAGLPGIVIACLVGGPVTLVEPRRLRAEFLHKAAESLRLDVTILRAKVQRAQGKYDVITARAVAALPQLLEISAHLSTRKTLWLLPKGRSAARELAAAQQAWQGAFHVERSVTDAESLIVVGTGVRARR
jgi:16S rRNA (guanine527-N7)-methyltransferase